MFCKIPDFKKLSFYDGKDGIMTGALREKEGTMSVVKKQNEPNAEISVSGKNQPSDCTLSIGVIMSVKRTPNFSLTTTTSPRATSF